MNILHVIQSYPPVMGGSEIWCREVARSARRRGCQVRVFTTTVTSERDYARELPPGARTMHLGSLSFDDGVEVRRFPRSLPSYWAMVLMRRILDERLGIHCYPPHSLTLYRALGSAVQWADLVHLHTLPYPHVLVGMAWGRWFRKPVVITPHFHIGHPHFERWLSYQVLRRCHRVLVMTDRERDHLLAHGVLSDRIVVTGDGVDPAQYVEVLGEDINGSMAQGVLPPDEPMVLFLGRKEPYKGLPTLLRAFQQVRREHPRAALYLVGHRTDWFVRFWWRCPAAAKVGVVERDGVPHEVKVRLLHRAHVTVLPSRFEAFGIVLLESWLCGTPVIVPEDGAPAEVASDGGVTFRLDDAQDLARQINRLLADPAMGRRLAEQGRARVLARHTWDHVGAATVRVYRTLRPRRRVLIVSHLYPPEALGGSEVVAFQEAEAWRRQGHEVRVFCGRLCDDQPRYALATRIDASVVRVNLHTADFDHRGHLTMHRPLLEAQCARCLDVFQPDVVHFHNIYALSAGLIEVCRQRRLPMVMTLHDYWALCLKNTMLTNADVVCQHNGLGCLDCQRIVSADEPVLLPVRNTLIKLSLRHVDRFIAPSQYLADRFMAHGFPAERVATIPNGIDAEAFRATVRRSRRIPRRQVVFGYLGYLGVHKGVEYLIWALARILAWDRAVVWIAGGGDPRYVAYLQGLCRQLHVSKAVRFVGRLPHRRVARWYRAIDVFVLPSIWPENCPITVLEAMASGVPVIASNVGGLPEILRHEETGWLVTRADAHALAQAMERLIDDPQLRERLGHQAAREVGTRASLADHVASVEQIHAQALEGGLVPPMTIDLVVCAGFNGRDPSLETLLRLWRAYVERTGRELPDVCEMKHLTDEQLREAKVLVVPEWHVRFAEEIERAARCGVPILGPQAQTPVRWVPRAASVRTYVTEQDFVRELSGMRHPIGQVGQAEGLATCLTA